MHAGRPPSHSAHLAPCHDWAVTLVLPRLDYCNEVLAAALLVNQLSRLQSVLTAAALSIYGARRCDHVTPLLQKLHWLSVPELVEFKLCVLVYTGVCMEWDQNICQVTSRWRPTSSLVSDCVWPQMSLPWYL